MVLKLNNIKKWLCLFFHLMILLIFICKIIRMDSPFRHAHDINLNCYTNPLYKHLETGNVLRQSMKVKNSPSSSLILRHRHTWRIWQQFQEGLDYLNFSLISSLSYKSAEDSQRRCSLTSQPDNL